MVTVRIAQSELIERRGKALAAFSERTGIAINVFESTAEHDPPLDILQRDAFETIQLIRAGALEPLGRRAFHDGIDLDDFPQSLIDRFRASDLVYAIPCEMRSLALLYRRDLLDGLGIELPTTWNDLLGVAISFQGSSRAKGIAGFVGVGVAGFAENFHFLGESLFPSWGWQWNRGAGEPPRIDEPATVEALTFYVALIQQAGPPGFAELTREQARQHFRDGKSLFLIDTPAFWECARKETTGVDDARFGLALIPSGPTGRPEPGLSAAALSIPMTSSVIEEAWEVLKLLVAPEHLLDDALAHRKPESVRVSVFSDDRIESTYDSEVRAVLQQTRGFARINRPMIEGGVDLGDIAGAAAEAAISGLTTPGEALHIAQAMIDGMSWRR